MNEIQLKYGCNPNQKPSRIYMEDGSCLLYTSGWIKAKISIQISASEKKRNS